MELAKKNKLFRKELAESKQQRKKIKVAKIPVAISEGFPKESHNLNDDSPQSASERGGMERLPNAVSNDLSRHWNAATMIRANIEKEV